MKRTLWSCAMAVAVAAVACVAHANPPSGIHASYDVTRQELDVLVQHIVTDRAAHYIDKVVISKNGKEVATTTFTDQASHRDQVMPPFKIPAVSGDTFTIVATCNKWGRGEQQVVVP